MANSCKIIGKLPQNKKLFANHYLAEMGEKNAIIHTDD